MLEGKCLMTVSSCTSMVCPSLEESYTRSAVDTTVGGAFFFSSLETHRYQVQRHARKAGARAFCPAYRLSPQYPFVRDPSPFPMLFADIYPSHAVFSTVSQLTFTSYPLLPLLPINPYFQPTSFSPVTRQVLGWSSPFWCLSGRWDYPCRLVRA